MLTISVISEAKKRLDRNDTEYFIRIFLENKNKFQYFIRVDNTNLVSAFFVQYFWDKCILDLLKKLSCNMDEKGYTAGEIRSAEDWLRYKLIKNPLLELNESAVLVAENQEKMLAPTETISSTVNRIPGIHKKYIDPIEGDADSLMHIIVRLNDEHRWTREQIADWLDTLDEIPVF